MAEAETHEKKKKKGFSRRHETSEAHDIAHRAREEQALMKVRGVKERAATRVLRTPAQQIAELDRRLGAHVGATKERARLAKTVG
ncbi:MAG: hypothetical protein HYT12_02490 [Candidatus Liptonbacteria bacterium]|nr:hypothetical protein [Candidatus Liptonbacteria bacterium]